MAETDASRRLRYRLTRLGTLELEEWLKPIIHALQTDPSLLPDIERLLKLEPPELETLMHHPEKIPPALRPWLEASL